MKLYKLKIQKLIQLLTHNYNELVLLFIATTLYFNLNFPFQYLYEYFIILFVIGTGILHYIALTEEAMQHYLNFTTALVRFGIASVFLSLFLLGKLGYEALILSSFDFIYVSVFVIWLYQPTQEEEIIHA